MFAAASPNPENSPSAGGSFLPALTGLRFFAALHVVGHHLRSSRLLDLQAWPEVDRFFQRAGASVGLFFILSGFILTYGNLNRQRSKPFRTAAFLRDRFARIYPVYFLGLLLTLPMFLIERSYLGDGAVSRETLLFGGLVLTLTQAWLPNAALAWNVPGWSLSVEFFFYLLFPAALAGLQRGSRRALVGGIVCCGGVAIGLAFYVAMNAIAVRTATGLSPDQLTAVMKYDPLVRLPEFLFGMLLGRLFFLRNEAISHHPAARRADLPARGRSYGAAAAAAAFIGILAYCPNGILDLPIHNGLLAPLIGVLLWQLALGGRGLAAFLARPAIVALGQASFALYIVHTPIIQFSRIVMSIRGGAAATSPAVAALATVLAIIAALVVRKYYEEPLRKWIHGVGSKRARGGDAATGSTEPARATVAASPAVVGAR